MSSAQSSKATYSIAIWVGDNFDPPWTDYVGRFNIDQEIEHGLVQAYCKTGPKLRLDDIDLARLNLRRALCQLRRLEVIQATLDDPHKRLHRSTDLVLICGYLGPSAFPVLVENYEAAETNDAQQIVILQSIAQILIWNRSAHLMVADKLNCWLANFTMQNGLINGLLIEVAKLIEEPPKELTDIIEESLRLPLYFDDQQQLLGPFKPIKLFSKEVGK